MNAHKNRYPRKISRLMEDNDLAELVTILRHPDDSAMRAFAAEALGESGDTSITEDLVRSFLEDPDPIVKSAARGALDQLLGGQAELAISVQRGAGAEAEPWLQERAPRKNNPNERGPAEGEGQFGEDLQGEDAGDEEAFTSTEVEGFARVALYEGNETLRLQAIRVLSRSSDMRATDTLANLALWGDSRRLREAARAALDQRYGEQAAEIIESYRSAALEEARQSDPDLAEDDLFPDEEDELGDLDEDLEDEEDEIDADLEQDEDENEDMDEDMEEDEQPTPFPSPYPKSPESYVQGNSDRRSRPVVEKLGINWGIILLAALGFIILAVAFFFGK